MPLNREQFLAPSRLRVEPVTIDGFDEPLYVRSMTGRERDAFEGEQLELNGQGRTLENFRARLIVRCLCDADGRRLLADADAAAVGEKDAAILKPLFDAAQRLNGLDKEAGDAAAKK